MALPLLDEAPGSHRPWCDSWDIVLRFVMGLLAVGTLCLHKRDGLGREGGG